MAYEIADKLKKIAAYDPIEGNYAIRLDANESCYNINEVIGDKIAEAIKNVALNRYPDPMAKDVVNTFADYYGISSDTVTAGNGSDELISIISSCFLEKGNSVLTLAPDFSMYAFYGSLYELDVHTLNKNEDLNITVDTIIDYCNSNNIKALIFSNPCNPTSLGIEKDEIIRLIKSVSCLVILDEAYMDFWDQSILDRVNEFDNLIILKTCSKAIGIAAVRLGFAVACPKITSMLRTVKSPYNTDSVSQIIGKTILSEKVLLTEYRKKLIDSRTQLNAEIKKLSEKYSILEEVYNSVTNFVFIKTSSAKAIHTKLLEKSIAVRGFDGYLRINAGTEEENNAVIKALEEILNELDS
jgi:histidinol-phosphate aminotransferase